MPDSIDSIQGITEEQRAFLQRADQEAAAGPERSDKATSVAELDAFVWNHANLPLTGAQIHDLRSKVAGLEPPRGGMPRDVTLAKHFFHWPYQTVLDVRDGGKVIGNVTETNAWTPFQGTRMVWRDAKGDLIASARKLDPTQAMARMLTEGRLGGVIQIDDAKGQPIGRMVERFWDTATSGHTQTRFEVWVADSKESSGYRLAAFSRKTQTQNSRSTSLEIYASNERETPLASAHRDSDAWFWNADYWRDRWTAHTIQSADELDPAFIVFSAAFKSEAGDSSTTSDPKPKG